jgi:hypothetical protein
MDRQRRRMRRLRRFARGGLRPAAPRSRPPAAPPGAWARRLLPLAPLVLLLLAFIPSMTPAAATESSLSATPVGSTSGQVAYQERLATRRQQLRREREERSGTRVTPYGHVAITCTSVTWYYEHFPDAANNTVSEIVSIDHLSVLRQTFTFDGASGSHTTAITVPAGLHTIDTRAFWNTNGLKAGWDIGASRVCGREAAPGFVIEKRQSTVGAFTPAPVTGQVGQAVRYEIIITNTGNVTLSLSNFEDAHCDPGTLTGGASGSLEPGAVARYRCQHVLTEADLAAGSYSNVATVTATGPGGPAASGGAGGSVGGETAGSSSGIGGILDSSQAARGGVLASTARVPALSAPQGCVRGSFRASIASRGVQRVTFYLDRRKVKTLTYKSARKGRLTARIDVSRAKLGPHRLRAQITMKPTATSARAVAASRSRTIVVCRSSVVSPKFTG